MSTSDDDCITKEMGIRQIWRGGREKARARRDAHEGTKTDQLLWDGGETVVGMWSS